MSKHDTKIADVPEGTGDLLSLPGMTPELAGTLLTALRVTNRAELKRALAAGRVVGLRGFTRELRSRLQVALEAGHDPA